MATADAGSPAVGRELGRRRGAPDAHAAPAPAARARSARLAGALALVAIVVLVLAIVLAAAERPSFLSPFTHPGYFPSWMAGPLSGLVPGLTSDDGSLRALAGGAIALLFASYVVAWRCADRVPAAALIGAIVAVQAILLCAPPLFSTDVFNYLDYGRMGVVHGLNPYTTIPALEPHGDPAYAISNWHQLLSPYGPLFTLLTYALVPLGVAVSFWAMKVIIALASLATLALLWRCAELLGRSPRAVIAFVGLNPLVLVWGLGADHNDALMMLLVMAAVLLALRACRAEPAQARGADRLAAGSGAALVAAIAIKASAGVLLPILLLTGRARAKLAGALAAGLVLALASFLAFGANLPDVGTQSRLVTPLGFANVLGVVLGLGGETAGLRTVLTVLLGATVLGAALLTWRAPARALTAAFACMLALVLTLSWSAAWYVLWVLPFAALTRERTPRLLALLLSAYLILAFAPNEPLVHRPLSLPLYRTALGRAHTDEINRLLR